MLGDLISAGANLINGIFNRSAQEDANAANLAQARENNATQREFAQKNLDQQREFAQQGVRWKVSDAVAAGLHPLAALGAQTSSFSPITVGSSSADIKPASLDLGSMGQNLGRAIDQGSTSQERTSRLQQQVARIGTALSLEKASLDNELVRSEIAVKRAQLGPPIPIPRPGPDRTISGHAVSDDQVKQKPEDYPQTGIVRPFGYPLYSNPFFSDGQQFEDRYGESEIGSTLKFGVNTLADHVYTGYRLMPKTEEDRFGPSDGDRRRFMRRTQGWR